MQSPNTGSGPTAAAAASASAFKSPVQIKPLVNQLRTELSTNNSSSSKASTQSKEPSKTLDIIPRKLDINEISLQLLDEIDPTFWSLQTFLKTVGSFSGTYYQELSFNQLVKSYTASLCLHTLNKNDHYYDKTMSFESPIKIINDLMNCQTRMVRDGKSIGEDKAFYVLSTLQKLGDLLDQIKTASDSERFTLYQTIIWPNESSIATLVHYFPIFNDLLPLRKTDAKAEICLAKLKDELESITNAKVVNQLVLDHESFEKYVESVYKEVSQWYTGNLVLPTTPRKRSFDFVDASFNTTKELDPSRQSENSFDTSPITKAKSQARKRRRYSIA